MRDTVDIRFNGNSSASKNGFDNHAPSKVGFSRQKSTEYLSSIVKTDRCVQLSKYSSMTNLPKEVSFRGIQSADRQLSNQDLPIVELARFASNAELHQEITNRRQFYHDLRSRNPTESSIPRRRRILPSLPQSAKSYSELSRISEAPQIRGRLTSHQNSDISSEFNGQFSATLPRAGKKRNGSSVSSVNGALSHLSLNSLQNSDSTNSGMSYNCKSGIRKSLAASDSNYSDDHDYESKNKLKRNGILNGKQSNRNLEEFTRLVEGCQSGVGPGLGSWKSVPNMNNGRAQTLTSKVQNRSSKHLTYSHNSTYNASGTINIPTNRRKQNLTSISDEILEHPEDAMINENCEDELNVLRGHNLSRIPQSRQRMMKPVNTSRLNAYHSDRSSSSSENNVFEGDGNTSNSQISMFKLMEFCTFKSISVNEITETIAAEVLPLQEVYRLTRGSFSNSAESDNDLSRPITTGQLTCNPQHNGLNLGHTLQNSSKFGGSNKLYVKNSTLLGSHRSAFRVVSRRHSCAAELQRKSSDTSQKKSADKFPKETMVVVFTSSQDVGSISSRIEKYDIVLEINDQQVFGMSPVQTRLFLHQAMRHLPLRVVIARPRPQLPTAAPRVQNYPVTLKKGHSELYLNNIIPFAAPPGQNCPVKLKKGHSELYLNQISTSELAHPAGRILSSNHFSSISDLNDRHTFVPNTRAQLGNYKRQNSTCNSSETSELSSANSEGFKSSGESSVEKNYLIRPEESNSNRSMKLESGYDGAQEKNKILPDRSPYDSSCSSESEDLVYDSDYGWQKISSV